MYLKIHILLSSLDWVGLLYIGSGLGWVHRRVILLGFGLGWVGQIRSMDWVGFGKVNPMEALVGRKQKFLIA